VFGGSAYFDGTGDNLITPNDSALALGSGDFTVEANFYLTTSNTTQCILDFRTAAGSSTGFFLGIVESGKIQVWNGGSAILSNAIVTTGRWYHLALVRKSTTLTAYLDGVAVATNTSSSTNFTDNRCSIGSSPVDSGVKLIGYLSDIRITKSAVYTSNFVPPTQPLQTVPNTTLLLNMDKSAIQDKSGKVVLETVGDAKVSTAQKKYGTSSLYFDGTGDGLQLPITPQVYLGTTYTIEAWIYSAGGLYYQAIFELCENNTGGFAGLDLIKVGTTIGASVRTTTLGTPVAITGGTLVTNTWQHVALSVNAGSAKLFLDGIQIGSTTTFPEFPIAKTLFAAVGRFANGYTAADTNSWNGYIDDLRITKGYARYTANFTPPAQALLTK